VTIEVSRNLAYDRREGCCQSVIYEFAGVAWDPSGEEVWTSSPMQTGELHALSLSGHVRSPLTAAGRLRLRDIAANGTLLVEQGIIRYGIIL